MSTPFIGSGRKIESGFLVVHKQDFNAHWEGSGFFHKANQIKMNPPLSGLEKDDVQQTLEALLNAIHSNGSGFISIGDLDGYAVGNYNVSSTKSFYQAFNEAVLDNRLKNGGVILILAGTYSIDQTVTVPAGISVMGEIGGTYLIGGTIEQSMFLVKSAKIKSIGPQDSMIGSEYSQSYFYNLNIFDNLNGLTANMSSVPMISVENGSNAIFEKVSFFGKLNGVESLNRVKTRSAIGTVSGITQGTSLQIKNCFFDGLKIPVEFVPQYGDNDFLKITDSKFRFFGKEGASYSPQDDCAILSSIGNISISNNYIFGAGRYSNALLTLIDSSSLSVLNYKISLVNNLGYPTILSGKIIDNQSSFTTINTVLANNNWGNDNESSWFITISANKSGDLIGSKSLDYALLIANSYNTETTIILNPGTYTLNLASDSSKNWSKTKLIGNKNGNSYPVVQLNISSSLKDALNNKYFVLGNSIESIYFTSQSSFQSVHLSFNPSSISSQNPSHLINVKDCVFVNTCLSFIDTGLSSGSDQLGNDASIQINIENCNFLQTGDFADNLSLACPRVDILNLKNCYFKGNGYAINIGTELFSAYPITTSIIKMDNIICNLSEKTISAILPGGSASNSYITINDSVAKLEINSCQFFADDSFGSATSIGSSLLLTNATFQKFISITSADILINNSLFNGPNQNFQISSTNYALPCLYLLPSASCKILNTKFHSGGLPCQIAGSFSSTELRDGLIIDNCTFYHVNGSTTQTLLDIDVEQSISTINAQISINNCQFISRNSSNPIQINHIYVTGTNYNTQGIVQIYCIGANVNLFNNKIYGTINEPTINPYTNFSGLYINTFNSDSGSSSIVTNANVENNVIQITNNYTSASSSKNASCLHVLSTLISICENELMMDNEAAINSSFSGCLVLDGRLINSTGDAIISKNSFYRSTSGGTLKALAVGYINILSSTNYRGRIVENNFDSQTFDGASSSLIVDNTSSTNKWWHERNKNQVKTLVLRGNVGNLGVKTTSAFYYVLAGSVLTQTNVAFVYSPTATVIMDFEDTNVDQTAIWSVALYPIIPLGAYILRATVAATVDTNPDVTSIITMYLKNTSTSINSSQNPLTTSGTTLSLSPSTNSMVSSPDQVLTLEIVGRERSSMRASMIIDQITITYTY